LILLLIVTVVSYIITLKARVFLFLSLPFVQPPQFEGLACVECEANEEILTLNYSPYYYSLGQGRVK